MDSQPGALDFAVLDEVVSHPEGPANGDGEPQTFAASAAGEDRAVHTDHLAERVHEGATRVARVDRCVRLNHSKVDHSILAARHDVSVQCGDHAGCDRGLGIRKQVPERVTDRQGPLPDHEVFGGADRRDREGRARHLEDRDIGDLVAPNELGRKIAAVRERDHDPVRSPYHVGVRHDVAVTTHEEAGPEARTLPRTWHPRVEEVEHGAADLLRADHVDADHGRCDPASRPDDGRAAGLPNPVG